MVDAGLEMWNTLWGMLLNGESASLSLMIFFSMILLERLIFIVAGQPKSNWKSDLSNIAALFIAGIGSVIFAGAVFAGLYLFFYQFRLFDVPIAAPWAWVLIFVVHEFCYYADHRLSHKIGFFWVFHQVHHGSNHMDISVGGRISPFDQIVQWTYWLIMPILGFSLIHFVALKFFVNIWGTFNHTRAVKRMGILDHFLATPSNHRVHHGRQAKYLDRNYGQVTVLFDHLFGSYQREEEEPDYGLVERLKGYNPIDAQIVGMKWLWLKTKSAPKWQDKLAYFWKPPGWSHTGDHSTSDVLAKQFAGEI